MPTSLHGLTPEELVALAGEMGEPAFRGRQLARGLYVRGASSLDELTDLPAALRERLGVSPGFCGVQVAEHQADADGTHKYLLGLADGARVEAVAIPRPGGKRTFCLSSQVGCRMACVFCATGRMGLLRQLEPGEIVGQVLFLRRQHPTATHPNLVFMGMGEPLANALTILTHPDGVGLSARRITVSTSGLVEGIRRLRDLGRPFGLAVSLTTADPDERTALMPIAGRTPLEELLEEAAAYGRATHRKVTLECALIAGRNDRESHARHLLALARRGPFKVNLIPLNPIEDFGGGRPEASTVARFADVLWQGGVVCTVRDSAGRDIDGACGQLLHRQRRRDFGSSDDEE